MTPFNFLSLQIKVRIKINNFLELQMPFWSVIKYKPKDGCEDEFLKRAERLENQIGNDTRLSVWLKTTDCQVVQLRCKPSLDAILGTQDIGLDWLDCVDHLLEKDVKSSRTAAYSGYEVDDLRREIGLKLDYSNAYSNPPHNY